MKRRHVEFLQVAVLMAVLVSAVVIVLSFLIEPDPECGWFRSIGPPVIVYALFMGLYWMVETEGSAREERREKQRDISDPRNGPESICGMCNWCEQYYPERELEEIATAEEAGGFPVNKCRKCRDSGRPMMGQAPVDDVEGKAEGG